MIVIKRRGSGASAFQERTRRERIRSIHSSVRAGMRKGEAMACNQCCTRLGGLKWLRNMQRSEIAPDGEKPIFEGVHVFPRRDRWRWRWFRPSLPTTWPSSVAGGSRYAKERAWCGWALEKCLEWVVTERSALCVGPERPRFRLRAKDECSS